MNRTDVANTAEPAFQFMPEGFYYAVPAERLHEVIDALVSNGSYFRTIGYSGGGAKITIFTAEDMTRVSDILGTTGQPSAIPVPRNVLEMVLECLETDESIPAARMMVADKIRRAIADLTDGGFGV